LAILKKSGAGKVQDSTPGAITPGSEPLKKIINLFFISIINPQGLKSTILRELSERIKKNIKEMLGYYKSIRIFVM